MRFRAAQGFRREDFHFVRPWVKGFRREAPKTETPKLIKQDFGLGDYIILIGFSDLGFKVFTFRGTTPVWSFISGSGLTCLPSRPRPSCQQRQSAVSQKLQPTLVNLPWGGGGGRGCNVFFFYG